MIIKISDKEAVSYTHLNGAAKEVYAMRKKMIAMLFALILSLSGCGDVSTAPEESDNYELVTETEAAAEAESTESSSFSESTESKSAKTDTALESDAEATACEPVDSETPKPVSYTHLLLPLHRADRYADARKRVHPYGR